MNVVNILLLSTLVFGVFQTPVTANITAYSNIYDINVNEFNPYSTINPDANKDIPKWTSSRSVYGITTLIKKLMGIHMYKRPLIRMYYNISDEDKLKCPSCDGSYDEIVDNQIWLTKNATRDDMIIMIIMYYQIHARGMGDSMLYSTVAKGERMFFLDQWKKHYNEISPHNRHDTTP